MEYVALVIVVKPRLPTTTTGIAVSLKVMIKVDVFFKMKVIWTLIAVTGEENTVFVSFYGLNNNYNLARFLLV